MLSQLLTVLLSITGSMHQLPNTPENFSAKQIHCLAETIYHEARGEPFDGQRAVASVVLNRTDIPEFPSEICKVVYQPGQFAWVGKVKPPNPKSLVFIKMEMIATFVILKHELGFTVGPERTYNATFFSRGPVKLKYRSVGYLGMIGAHKFYELGPPRS